MMSTEQIQGSFAEESSPTQLKSSLLLPGTRVCSGALATDVLPEGPDKERLLIDLSAPNAAPSPRLWAPSVGSLNSQVTSQQSEPSWEMLNRPGGVSNEQVHCAALDVLSVDGHDSQPDQPLSALLQDLLSDQPEKVDDTDSVSIPEERWVQLFQLMERQHNEKMIEQHEQHNQQIQLLQSQMTSPKLPIRDDRGVQKTDHLVDKPHGPSGCLSLSEVGPPVSSSGVHQCSVRETVLCCFRTQDEAILRSSQPHPGHLSRNCANQVTVSAMTEPHSIFQQIITVEALPCIASSLNDETEFDSSQQCRNLQLCVQKQTDKQGGPVEPQGEPTEIGNDISSASEEDIGIKGTLSLDDCTVYCSAASTLKPLEMHAATESLNGTSEFAAVILTSADREEVTSQGSSPELMTVTSNEQEFKPIACGSANDNTAVVQGLQEQLISASSDTSTEGKADLPLIGSEKEAASSAAVLTVHTSASQTEGEQDDNGPMENAIHLASLLGVVGSCNVLDPEGECGNTSGETCSLEEGNPLRVTSHVYNGSCNEVVTFSQEILNQCRPFTSWAERQKQCRSKDLQADTENVASLEGKVMPSEKHLQSDHGNDVEPTEVTTPKEAWQPGIPDGPFVSSYTDKSNSPSRTVSLDSLCHNESDDCPEPAGSIVHGGKSSDLPTTSCTQANQCPNSAVQTFSMSSLPSQISSSPTPSLHASLSLSGPQIPAHLPSLQLATPASSTSLPPQQGGSLSLNCSLRDLFHGRRTQSLKENSCDIEGFWLGAAAHPPLQVRPIENPQQVKQQGNLSNSLFYTSPSQHGHFVPLVGNMSRLSCPSRSESSVLGSSASVVGVSANHREVIEEELQLSHPVFIHPGQEGSNYACSLDDSEATATTLESCDPVQLSRLRVFLREKHTRHLSDVRAYYEAELAALTKQLAHRDASSSHRDTALTVTGLSERCKEAEKALHSATLRIHDLESRNRDLERELGAWPERYDTAVQATHMMQRTLEEVRTRCEREEHAAKALRTRVREVERAYNDLYHSADNREERSHRERRMLQDLLAEYETLTKENAHMKETLRSTENRLIDANDETAELKRLNSRLEVQIKQIEHGRNLTHARGSDGISDLLHISISPSHRDGKASTNCSPRHVSSNRRKWLTSPQEVPFATPNHQVEARMHSPPEKDGGSRSCDSPRSGSPDLGPVLRACQDLRDAEQTSSVANRSPGTHKHRSSKNSQGKSRPEHDGSCGEVNEEGRRHPSPITTPLSSWPTRRSSSVPPADRCQPAVLGKQTASISASPRKDSHAAQQRDAVLPGYGQFHKKEEGQSTSLEPVARLSNKKRLNLALNPSASAPSSPPLSGQGNSLQGRAHVNGSARGGTPPKQSQWDTGSSSRASWGSVRPVALTAPYETEFSVQERRQTLGQLDRRLDELTLEKGQIESALSRIPTAAGRATRQVRMDQEVLEERLDEVNRELGSVRMTLKRFHILRTSSHP